MSMPSTVARGTRFEWACVRLLQGCVQAAGGTPHSHSDAAPPAALISRVGGRGDAGVDLMVTLPAGGAHTTLYVQCKAEEARLGPGVVRELLGTLSSTAATAALHTAGGVPGRTSAGVSAVGVLACRAGFTSAALAAVQSSSLPLVCATLARLGGSESDDWLLTQVFLNAAAQARLPQLSVVYPSVRVSQAGAGVVTPEPVRLFWNGRCVYAGAQLPRLA